MESMHGPRPRKLLGLVAALVVFATSFAAAAAAPQGGARVVDSRSAAWSAEPVECEFLGLINQHRKNNGLGSLTISLTLSAAAEFHSADMATNGYFGHTLFDGTTWQQNIANHGYPSDTYRGENIAAGRDTAAGVFEQWKNSPDHNANMLSANFNAIGIGRVKLDGSRYTWYWTNTFGSRVDQAFSCSGQAPTGGGETSGTQLTITGGGRTSNSANSQVAYDGKTGTFWYTTGSGTPSSAYVYLDLGASKSIGKIGWFFAKSGSADSYKIQLSNDKATWTTVSNQTNGKSGSWYTKQVGKKARYVRFYFNNPNRDKVLGYLAEVKVYA